MSVATMSVLGLYNWDNTLFDGMTIPTDVSRETLINNILFECAELECIYTNPSFLKFAITSWSAVKSEIWADELETLKLEYNPIENYDRIEESTDAENGDSVGDNTATSAQTAFDTDAFKDTGKTTSGGSNNYRRNNEHRSRIHGNVGVTTSQQMLLSQLDIDKLNIYELIVSDFKRRFCLLVY